MRITYLMPRLVVYAPRKMQSVVVLVMIGGVGKQIKRVRLVLNGVSVDSRCRQHSNG